MDPFLRDLVPPTTEPVVEVSEQVIEPTVEVTEQEQQTALQLIDLAIKAGGVQVARAGADLAEKIAKPEPQPTSDE